MDSRAEMTVEPERLSRKGLCLRACGQTNSFLSAARWTIGEPAPVVIQGEDTAISIVDLEPETRWMLGQTWSCAAPDSRTTRRARPKDDRPDPGAAAH